VEREGIGRGLAVVTVRTKRDVRHHVTGARFDGGRVHVTFELLGAVAIVQADRNVLHE
jgi:hypothetical protein